VTLLLVPGLLIAVAGLAGLGWCIVEARRIGRAGLAEAEAKARLSRLVTVNAAAIAAGFLGAAMALVAVILQG
jgi:hypothetical protein